MFGLLRRGGLHPLCRIMSKDDTLSHQVSFLKMKLFLFKLAVVHLSRLVCERVVECCYAHSSGPYVSQLIHTNMSNPVHGYQIKR